MKRATTAFPALVLIVMWVAVIWTFNVPEIDSGHGFAHDRFSGMDQGGDGSLRHERMLFPGWLMASAIIFIFGGLLAWSAENSYQATYVRMRRCAFLISMLVYEAVFTILFLQYADSLGAEDNPLFIGSFPASTWWLLFGVWLAPGFFIAIFVGGFHRWIATPSAMARFHELVAANPAMALNPATHPKRNSV